MDKDNHKGWIVDEEKTDESSLTANYNYYNCADREHSAMVKSDGCIHFNFGFDDERTYIHICELDQLIETFVLLRELGKKHFGEKWQ